MLKFLTLNFQAGAEYSSISTARSALTSLTGSMNGSTLPKQPLLQRYIKKFLICTVFPKCTITWDPNNVLNYFASLSHKS